MFHSDFSISASSDFIALCQSQVALLSQIGAVWSAVYVTEGLAENYADKLVAVAVYPREAAQKSALQDQRPEVPAALSKLNLPTQLPSRLLTAVPEEAGATAETAIEFPGVQELQVLPKYQLVLPLSYQEGVVGLLVTRREDRPWLQGELAQIHNVAQTLAIARLLDRHQAWYKQQLEAQQQIRIQERDRLETLLHQLRNPLTALRTFSKLLLKRLLPEDRNHPVANSILRESDRLQDLLQQFEQVQQPLDSSLLTLEASTTPALPEATSFIQAEATAVAVEELLELLLVSAQAIAQERNIELTADLPPMPPVRGNAKALREVFSNLLDNALKYTPAGGQVRIYKVPQRGIWQGIAIQDTGYGIPASEQKRIFERHYRGIQADSEIPGSGLGLAIARELVEQMQGKIELISPNPEQTTPLPGTTFIVWLPTADSSVQN
ncbi:MAG: sensor histidine kinase [Cyanophyceae cyanobacterium]